MQKKYVSSPRKTQHIIRSENRDKKHTSSDNIHIIYAYGMNYFRVEIILNDTENSTIKHYCAYTFDNNHQEVRKCDKGSF